MTFIIILQGQSWGSYPSITYKYPRCSVCQISIIQRGLLTRWLCRSQWISWSWFQYYTNRACVVRQLHTSHHGNVTCSTDLIIQVGVWSTQRSHLLCTPGGHTGTWWSNCETTGALGEYYMMSVCVLQGAEQFLSWCRTGFFFSVVISYLWKDLRSTPVRGCGRSSNCLDLRAKSHIQLQDS